MRSVPDSHLINDYQPLDHRLISFTISTYSAAWDIPELTLSLSAIEWGTESHRLKERHPFCPSVVGCLVPCATSMLLFW